MEATRKRPLTAPGAVHTVFFSTELLDMHTFEDPSSSEAEAEDLFWASADGNGVDDDEPLEVNAKLVEAADPGSRWLSASTGAESDVGQDANASADIGDEDDRDGGDEGEVAAANPFESAVERRRIRRCATVGQGARPDFELSSLPAVSHLWQRRRSAPKLTSS